MMSKDHIEEHINAVVKKYNVSIHFTKSAFQDLKYYAQSERETILALIIAQARKNPLSRPIGTGKPLSKKLRIIYRPTSNGLITMAIIAIGPRDRDIDYKKAVQRINNK